MDAKTSNRTPEEMTVAAKFRRWLGRTPVHTFILCPAAVFVAETMLHRGRPSFVIWGIPLLLWGYLQYRYVGRYRHPRAGGSSGMDVPPDQIVDTGPYSFCRNPMYLGHVIFMAGLAITFWSWIAFILLIVRAVWFHSRVLNDERRLHLRFGQPYAEFCQRVKRWVPGVI